MTQYAERHYLNIYLDNINKLLPIGDKGQRAVILQPGEMVKVNHPLLGFNSLNLYYDLSEEGEYELTFYTRNFLADDEHQIGKHPGPCTVRFKIESHTNWLDSQVVWPEEE